MAACPETQARYNLVFAHLLAGTFGLARTGELLDLSWPAMRARCARLDVPLRNAPADAEEARRDVETARTWADPSVP